MTDVPLTAAITNLTLAGAQRVLAAALAHAAEQGVPMCVAVTDRAGQLLAYAKMDGAPAGCGQIAQDKAYSVAVFDGVPTHEWWSELAAEPPLLHGFVKTDRLVVFGGGVPVKVGDELVGAIGVSGGTTEEDRAVAEAGAALPGRATMNP